MNFFTDLKKKYNIDDEEVELFIDWLIATKNEQALANITFNTLESFYKEYLKR